MNGGARPTYDCEGIPGPLLYLVEWRDPQYAGVERAPWRVRGRRRIRQSLLPGEGRAHRSGAWLRAALGDLQARGGGLDDRAGVASLDALHRRYSAHRREGDAAAVVEAPSPQSHRHSLGLPSDWLDARPESP